MAGVILITLVAVVAATADSDLLGLPGEFIEQYAKARNIHKVLLIMEDSHSSKVACNIESNLMIKLVQIVQGVP